MLRSILQKMLAWKQSAFRKPLILRGARQVGKTFALKAFGRDHYEHTAYFNFEEDPALAGFFEGRLSPEKILRDLSLYSGAKILPEKTLLILDEIQAANTALNSLKYFCEMAQEYHVAAAGSLLGIALSRPSSFPVGKVDFLNLYPMTFAEYLQAHGQGGLLAAFNDLSRIEPLAEGFHRELTGYLKRYLIVGGMPEAVAREVASDDLEQVRTVQRAILDAYAFDMAKWADPTELPKLRRIWGMVPGQLARENKKFTYGTLKKGARAREYEQALAWLESTGILLRANRVTTPGWPLSGYAEPNHFKTYFLDVGLLGAMSDLAPIIILDGEKLFREFHGALTENFVAQTLTAGGFGQLYYWTSNGTSEVDFLVPWQNRIFPLEVKAGISRKAKSLRVYADKYAPNLLCRSNLRNLKRDGDLLNLPLYALDDLDRLLQLSTANRVH